MTHLPQNYFIPEGQRTERRVFLICETETSSLTCFMLNVYALVIAKISMKRDIVSDHIIDFFRKPKVKFMTLCFISDTLFHKKLLKVRFYSFP